MKEDLVGMLSCVRCRGGLILRAAEARAGAVWSGVLACVSCGVAYPIEDGIPDFLAPSSEPTDRSDMHGQVLLANVSVYDQLADGYMPESRVGLSRAHMCAKLEKLSHLTGGGCLLDLGCGNGLVARLAGPFFRRIVGVDASMAMLRNVATPMDLVRGDICHLPFKDNAFDCLTAVAVLHHLFDTSAVLTESLRVLRPQGLLYTEMDHNWRLFYLYGLLMSAQQLFRVHVLPDRDMARALDAISGDVTGDNVPKGTAALAEYHQCQSMGFDPLVIRRLACDIGFASARVEWRGSWNSNLTARERGLNVVLRLLSQTPLAQYASSHFSIVAAK